MLEILNFFRWDILNSGGNLGVLFCQEKEFKF